MRIIMLLKTRCWLLSLLLVSLNLLATETSDNLLINNTFDENTNGWTLSDSNVKRDANSYSDAGNSPTVRFNRQTSTISQLVNITGIETGKEILSYTISYNGYGCGNAPGGWCNDEADDTVITNITFTDGTTTEVSSNVITVPYEDGWTYHTFTKSINDTFLIGEVAINFELTGIDTGDSSSWLGPITDNYQFSITYDDYVQQQVQEQVVEETMIGGLELSTEVTLDLIQDIQVMPEMEMEMTIDMPEIEMDMAGIPSETSIDMPDMIDMPPAIQEIRMEMTVDIPEIVDVEPIQEIQEIKIEVVETEINQPEMEEIKDEGRKIEPETERKVETTKTTAKGSDLRESESDTGEEGERETEESTADSNKGDESKETTTVAKSKNTSTKDSGSDKSTTKTKSKSKAKDNAKSDRPADTSKKTTSKVKAELPVNTAKPKTIEQLPLPIAYLQIMQDSISIVETISLRQEQIYGGEQEYNLNTSSITIVGLDNNSSSRWSNLQNERKRYQAPKYNNRYKEN